MCTFEYITTVTVKMDGKAIGVIKEVEGGYQYFPKGSKTGGDILASVAAVRATLEAP